MDRFSSCCSDVLIYLWYVNSIQSSFCRSINVWKHQFAIGQQLPCKIIRHIVSTCVVTIFYKCSEKCAPWLVRTSSLYFHKARALRHTSVLLRYNARSLRHRYELAQFTTHFLKEIKTLVPRALLSYVSTCEFLRTLEKCEKHSPSARVSPHFLVFLKIPKCWYNSTMHSARFSFL